MFRNNNNSNQGNGFFTAANGSPNRENESALNADRISQLGGGGKSVSGIQLFKYQTDEVVDSVKTYSTITISDSSTLKSAITVSTAQVSGTTLVHKGEEGENNSFLFYQEIGTLARNITFGGSLDDQNQSNGSVTILSAIMDGNVDLHAAIFSVSKSIRNAIDEIEDLDGKVIYILDEDQPLSRESVILCIMEDTKRKESSAKKAESSSSSSSSSSTTSSSSSDDSAGGVELFDFDIDGLKGTVRIPSKDDQKLFSKGTDKWDRTDMIFALVAQQFKVVKSENALIKKKIKAEEKILERLRRVAEVLNHLGQLIILVYKKITVAVEKQPNINAMLMNLKRNNVTEDVNCVKFLGELNKSVNCMESMGIIRNLIGAFHLPAKPRDLKTNYETYSAWLQVSINLKLHSLISEDCFYAGAFMELMKNPNAENPETLKKDLSDKLHEIELKMKEAETAGVPYEPATSTQEIVPNCHILNALVGVVKQAILVKAESDRKVSQTKGITAITASVNNSNNKGGTGKQKGGEIIAAVETSGNEEVMEESEILQVNGDSVKTGESVKTKIRGGDKEIFRLWDELNLDDGDANIKQELWLTTHCSGKQQQPVVNFINKKRFRSDYIFRLYFDSKGNPKIATSTSTNTVCLICTNNKKHNIDVQKNGGGGRGKKSCVDNDIFCGPEKCLFCHKYGHGTGNKDFDCSELFNPDGTQRQFFGLKEVSRVAERIKHKILMQRLGGSGEKESTEGYPSLKSSSDNQKALLAIKNSMQISPAVSINKPTTSGGGRGGRGRETLYIPKSSSIQSTPTVSALPAGLYEKMVNSKERERKEETEEAVVSKLKIATTSHATLTGSVDTAESEQVVEAMLEKGFVEGVIEEDDASTDSLF